MTKEVIQYKTCGTCCQLINLVVEDNKIVDAEFFGGCNGNLQGLKKLIIGMTTDDIIEKLSGIKCGAKQTSCPDQLAQCLLKRKEKSAIIK